MPQPEQESGARWLLCILADAFGRWELMLFTVKPRKEAAAAPAVKQQLVPQVFGEPDGSFGLLGLFILVSWACRQLWKGLGE